MDNQYYIIRGDRSGVFFGRIGSRNGSEVEILDARRLWYWDGAASLSQLAMEGVTKPKNCKFTMTVSSLIVLDAIEIIPCTDSSVMSINEVPVWRV